MFIYSLQRNSNESHQTRERERGRSREIMRETTDNSW